nr:hypothetical protein Iba_chr11dCG4170 [Ipomoea batatas]
MPFSISQIIEAKAFTNFHRCHCSFLVLFVSENQDNCIEHKRISGYNLKLFFCLPNSLSIQRVNNIYQSIGIGKVMPPEGP